MSEDLRQGLEAVAHIGGAAMSKALEARIAAGGFGSRSLSVSVRTGGAAWQGSSLERKLQSAVVMTALIATRQTKELEVHAGCALDNGLTPEALDDLLAQLVPYLGVPAVATAREVIGEVLHARGLT